MTNTIRAWHFASSDGCLGYDDGRPIVVGETLSVEPPIVYCDRGLHASLHPYDALQYAPNRPRLCLVTLSGELDYDSDKIAAQHRLTLAMLTEHETAILLRRWACWCVRQVWDLLTDERSRRAVEIAEAWCDGRSTDAELADAASAAAVWAAANDAANDAASAAAWTAASSAAWTAASSAARAYAWATAASNAAAYATKVQRAELLRLCEEAIGGKAAA